MGNSGRSLGDTEKINLFVPGDIHEIIEYDIRMFEVYSHKKITPNRNRFINMLIKNYHDQFVAENNGLRNEIAAALHRLSLSRKTEREIAESLMREVLQPSAQRGGKGSRMISFKPWNDIGQIVELAKREMTAPQYFRRMIINYCRKPLSTREQIIFKIHYDQLCQKCRERKPIVISTTWKPEILHEVIPVSMSIGHEEMFNYLLCQEINPYTNVPEARSYALRRINGISDGRTTINLDETVEKHLREMKKKGPQYAINDDETICVRLTQKGQDYYQRIYFGRPFYSQIEEKPDGYYHYYQCSMDQVLFYYRRFDPRTVEILEPVSLREKMRNYFNDGAEVYKE